MLWPACSAEGSSEEKTQLKIESQMLVILIEEHTCVNLQISGTSVEVQVQSSATDVDGSQILHVVVLGSSGS